METNWGTAIVIDPRALQQLEADVESLRTARLWLGRALVVALGVCTLASANLYVTKGRAAAASERVVAATREAHLSHQRAVRSETALAALSQSHSRILAATEHTPSVGTTSWGRRFTVTKYLPRDPSYGKDNDGLTATMVKADPAARIVAVDPKLIPYGSWVWIEDLGWYRAEDCGAAIKGFRLDLLTATLDDAMSFGKQERFVIVVPTEKS